MKKGREIIISGPKGCGVGYRPFLLQAALGMGIEKIYAYNILGEGTETVVIQLQSDEDKLDRYVEAIRSRRPEHARVDKIEERCYLGDVMDAGVYLQLLQFEQITKAVPAILNIDKKQDAMIERQDATIAVLKEVKEDTSIMLEHQDATIAVLKEVKEDTSSIREDISGLKKDSMDSILEKYLELSREIAEIKATLSEIKAKVS